MSRSRIAAVYYLAFSIGLSLLPLLGPAGGYELPDKLREIIDQNSDIVKRLSNETEKIYMNRCEYENVTECLDMQEDHCSLLACKNRYYDRGKCVKDKFGTVEITTFQGNCSHNCTLRRLLFSDSVLTFPAEDLRKVESTQVASEICWSRELEPLFQLKADLHTLGPGTLRWQYIGMPTGLFRLFPGNVDVTCSGYDPRVRPWYVAATNGPLNVILVLDTSASMVRHNRLKRMKEAALDIVQTLSLVNHIGIVTFSDTARHKNIGKDDTLVRATRENINKVQEKINTLDDDIGWKTNFEDGFRKAFALLNHTEEARNETIHCPTAILFLTDGVPTAGEKNEDALVSKIQAWNRREDNSTRAFVFTFAVGTVVQTSTAKAIACGNNGIFSRISDEGRIRDKLSQYYDFLSAFIIGKDVVWVEPYVDASGLGNVTTVSRAVHDRTVFPPELVGVVAVDILATDLQKADPDNWMEGISSLASQARCADVHSKLSPCTLKALRAAKGNTESVCPSSIELNCNDTESDQKNTTKLTCGSVSNIPNICNSTRSHYQEEACCIGSSLETLPNADERCLAVTTFQVAYINKTLVNSALSVGPLQSSIATGTLGILAVVVVYVLCSL